METCQYRGYQIETRREWSNWCISVYRTRSRHTDLAATNAEHFDDAEMDDAVAEAKQSIDHVLSNLDS